MKGAVVPHMLGGSDSTAVLHNCSASSKYVQQRRLLKEDIVRELLKATLLDVDRFRLEHYIAGKPEKKKRSVHR